MSVRDILQAAAGLGGGVEKGPLFVTGNNPSGISGRNELTTTARSSPVQIGALDNWISVKGVVAAFAINSLGDLYAWGSGFRGTLGDNAAVNRSSPVQVGAGKTWAQAFPVGLISGPRNSFAITESGQLWAWGENANGGCGVNTDANTVSDYSSPVQVGSDTNWKQVVGNGATRLALRTDGTLWWWGFNEYGQAGINLGPPTQQLVSSPTQVGALTNWSQLANCTSTLAIKTDGTLWAWGLNDWGTCGLGNTVARSSPVQVGALSNWAQVAAGPVGQGPVYAIKTDGTLWGWGRGIIGALGTGVASDSRSSPVQIGADADWEYVWTGSYVCYATKTDGTLWVFGNNQQGQYGDSSVANASSPVQIGSGISFVDIAGTLQSTIFVRKA